MTSSHIHTTSLRRRFLSPCGGTHQGDGARGHVGSWQRAAPVLPSLKRERLRHLTLVRCKHCPHAERGNWQAEKHTRCCRASDSTPFYHGGRPYMMTAGPLSHTGGLGSVPRTERNSGHQQSILNREHSTPANLAAVDMISTGWTFICMLMVLKNSLPVPHERLHCHKKDQSICSVCASSCNRQCVRGHSASVLTRIQWNWTSPPGMGPVALFTSY